MVLNALGVVNSLMGKIIDALKNFKNAYELDPTNEAVKVNYKRAERTVKNSYDFIAVIKQDPEKIRYLKCLRCDSKNEVL